VRGGEGRGGGMIGQRAITRHFYVAGYRCTATICLEPAEAAAVEFAWEPFPKKRGYRFMMEYRKKRDAVLKAVATEINEAIAIVDFDGSVNRITTISPDKS